MLKVNLVLLSLFVVTGVARAQSCVSYGSESRTCISTGCNDVVVLSTCMIGCVSGSCNPNGNSTVCCGIRTDYAQIFTDGGTCQGKECGLARILRAEKQAKKIGSVAEAKSYTLPLPLPPRRLFVANRCTHEFDIAYDWVLEREGI